MFYCLFILPGKDRLLEAAEEASEVNIEEHRRMAYLSCLAKFKEVVFEELVAFHEVVPSGWIPAFAGMTGSGVEMTREDVGMTG